ncbi:MAG: helix-turn-helix domain-containing protein [bacterium]
MIEKTLSQFGLRDDEIKTFVFLLENGQQTAGVLAKKTGLSRPSLYGFLRKLKEMGLVTESQKNGIKTFFACSQEKLEKLFQEKIEELEQGRETVKKVYEMVSMNGILTNPKFQLFEGKEGLKQILKDMLLYRDLETKSYWPIQAMVEILGEGFFKELNRERIKRRLYTKAIWPESQKLDIKKHPYLGFGKAFMREIRIAPKNISFSMGYWIYGNKVACISSKKEAFGFIIESKELVEMLSSQFELMWYASKPITGKPEDGNDFLKNITS